MTEKTLAQTREAGATVTPATPTAFGLGGGAPGRESATRPERVAQYRAG